MSDEYIEEIHKIRDNIYNQTKDMSPQELIEYYRNSSKEVRQRVDEYRARYLSEKQAADKSKSVDRR